MAQLILYCLTGRGMLSRIAPLPFFNLAKVLCKFSSMSPPSSKDASIMDTSSVEKGDTSSSSTAPIQTDPTTTAAPDESKYFTGRKLYLINAGLIISIFLVTLESTVLSTAIVDITDELGGYSKSSWLFTAYMLTYCSSSPSPPPSLLTNSKLSRPPNDMGKSLGHNRPQIHNHLRPSPLHALLRSLRRSTIAYPTHHVPVVSGHRRLWRIRFSTVTVYGDCAEEEIAGVYGDG